MLQLAIAFFWQSELPHLIGTMLATSGFDVSILLVTSNPEMTTQILPDTDVTPRKSGLFTGIAVSPGVAIGPAFCLHEIPIPSVAAKLDDAASLDELARFEQGCQDTIADLQSLHDKVTAQVGENEGDIFLVHESILNDPALQNKIRSRIVDEHLSASAALRLALDECEDLFANIRDEYFKERLTDVRDVMRRLGRKLTNQQMHEFAIDSEPAVLVVDQLLPSDVVTLTEHNIAGIVTQTGGRTSHAAILARSYGIPAVSAAVGILEQVSQGDTIVVDGHDGHVLINPDDEAKRLYTKRRREFVRLRSTLAENAVLPALTADGTRLELLANINSLADTDLATQMGASGVGLFRTEFYFLTHPNVPDEDEQVEQYRAVIEQCPGNTVTIRTLDLGGDKTIPYLEGTREANPFMGWRSIRLSFEHPEFFATQIRAVLRAAAGSEKQVRLLFPMITTLEEIQAVRGFVARAQHELKSSGTPIGDVTIGLMVEVPAAALAIETLLDEVDFVSIGTNDLVQYLTAADRDNPKVNHLCQPLNPVILKLMRDVIESCQFDSKPVSVCGEMTGSPRGFLLLLGMGLRSFSMSPAFIPTIKNLASHIAIDDAQQILTHALELRTSNEVTQFVDERLNEICPEIARLETVSLHVGEVPLS